MLRLLACCYSAFAVTGRDREVVHRAFVHSGVFRLYLDLE